MKAEPIKEESQHIDKALSPFVSTEESNEIIKPANPNDQVLLGNYKNFRAPMEMQILKLQQPINALILASSMSDLTTFEREFQALPPFTTMHSGGTTEEASQKPKPSMCAKGNLMLGHQQAED